MGYWLWVIEAFWDRQLPSPPPKGEAGRGPLVVVDDGQREHVAAVEGDVVGACCQAAELNLGCCHGGSVGFSIGAGVHSLPCARHVRTLDGEATAVGSHAVTNLVVLALGTCDGHVASAATAVTAWKNRRTLR